VTPSTAQQIRVAEVSPAYWTVTFDNGPLNLIDPGTIRELDGLVSRLEEDPDVRVVVFRSASENYFLAHWDVLVDKDSVRSMPSGASGLHPWLDVLTRLSRLPVATIAAVRGRARGAGSEFALACDMRFASRERAVLGQFEVGLGAVPGGGPMARLSRLVGRGRALEIVLGGDDFDGDLAERYGYVNRSVPDAEFEVFVDSFARRLAGFDKRTIAEIKGFVDDVSLPPDEEFPLALEAFFTSVSRPATAARSAVLVKKGLQQDGEVELSLGYHVAHAEVAEAGNSQGKP
jgi:enoyl-CoA hydratase/carnithine racemase